jgi:hypothetical protein
MVEARGRVRAVAVTTSWCGDDGAGLRRGPARRGGRHGAVGGTARARLGLARPAP